MDRDVIIKLTGDALSGVASRRHASTPEEAAAAGAEAVALAKAAAAALDAELETAPAKPEKRPR